MGSMPNNFDILFLQTDEKDTDKKILAIDLLIQKKFPEAEKILIDLSINEKDEDVRIKAIQTLGKLKVPDPSNLFETLKKILITESAEFKKAALQAIVNLGDISAIKYLTKYYYSEHSKGIKDEVNEALEELMKPIDEKKPKTKSKKHIKKQKQKKLIEKAPKKKKDLDYESYIKKFFRF